MFVYFNPKADRYRTDERIIDQNLKCEHYFVYCSDAPYMNKAFNPTMVNAIYAACKWCGIPLSEYNKENLK